MNLGLIDPFARRVSESDSSSLNSVDLDAVVYADSDTGLESMSSAETPNKVCSLCLESGDGKAADSLRQEVTRLKCDKLDLLRQNVVRNLFSVNKCIALIYCRNIYSLLSFSTGCQLLLTHCSVQCSQLGCFGCVCPSRRPWSCTGYG